MRHFMFITLHLLHCQVGYLQMPGVLRIWTCERRWGWQIAV